MKEIIERMIALACCIPLIRKVLESAFTMLSHDTSCLKEKNAEPQNIRTKDETSH